MHAKTLQCAEKGQLEHKQTLQYQIQLFSTVHSMLYSQQSMPHIFTLHQNVVKMHENNCHSLSVCRTKGRLTSQQEGGAVRAELSPEGGEKVDELEGRQTLLGSQGWVHCSCNVEKNTYCSKPKQLQPETSNSGVVNH